MVISFQMYMAYVTTVLIFFAHPPGPGQLLFMSHSMRRGVRNSLPVIAGNHSANIIQMLLAGFGLVGVISASAELFIVVKWLGVGYLLWLGVSMMRRRASDIGSHQTDRSSSLVKQGFVTAAANPYALMFFAALFPQFLDPGAALGPQILILGATYLAIDGLILLALGASASRIMSWFGGQAMSGIHRLSGTLMIAAAVLLAFRGVEPRSDR